jgi:hypothetical protein
MDDEKSLNQDHNDHSSNSGKQARGRPFQKGNSGRKRGSKNKATLLAASLSAGQGEEILAKAVELAMGGNVPMMKFLLDRILPKERPIQLELPRLDWSHDGVEAMAKIVDAVSSGRITPREALDIGQLVSAFTQAIDTSDAQVEIDRLKSQLDGLKLDFNMDSSGRIKRKR